MNKTTALASLIIVSALAVASPARAAVPTITPTALKSSWTVAPASGTIDPRSRFGTPTGATTERSSWG